MKLITAIHTVIKQGNAAAKCYATWLSDNWDTCSEDEFETQLLYILSNITHMRGHDAKNARQVIKLRLKEFTK